MDEEGEDEDEEEDEEEGHDDEEEEDNAQVANEQRSETALVDDAEDLSRPNFDQAAAKVRKQL